MKGKMKGAVSLRLQNESSKPELVAVRGAQLLGDAGYAP